MAWLVIIGGGGGVCQGHRGLHYWAVLGNRFERLLILERNKDLYFIFKDNKTLPYIMYKYHIKKINEFICLCYIYSTQQNRFNDCTSKEIFLFSIYRSIPCSLVSSQPKMISKIYV